MGKAGVIVTLLGRRFERSEASGRVEEVEGGKGFEGGRSVHVTNHLPGWPNAGQVLNIFY